MLKLKLKSPRYPYWVQIKSKDELGLHTLDFLNQHATRPWAEITVQDINDFLASCYAQAQWTGDAYSVNVPAPRGLS